MTIVGFSKPRLGSRAAERVRVKVMVDVRNGRRRFRGEVADISTTGVRLRTRDQLSVGSTHWVRLPNLEAMEVRVAWVAEFVTGCVFKQPLAPYVFEALLKSALKPDAAVAYIDRRAVHPV